MTIKVTRESVCMGDDVMAPNGAEFDLPADTLLPAILALIENENYLASVVGDVTWSLWIGSRGATDATTTRLLAVLRVPASTSMASYRYTPGSEALQARDLPTLFFDYHCNADPVEVLRNPQIGR